MTPTPPHHDSSDSDQSSFPHLVTQYLLPTLESLGTPVCFLDTQFRYICFNTHYARVMKEIYGTDIKTGMSLLECLPIREERKLAEMYLDKALSGEIVLANSYFGEYTPAGRYFEVSHSPIRDPNGTIIGVSVVTKDRTDSVVARNSLFETEARLHGIISSSAAGIAFTDKYGYYLSVNDTFCQITGYSRAELQEKKIGDIAHPDDQKAALSRIHQIRDHLIRETRLELRVLTKQNQIRWIDLAISALFDKQQNISHCISIITDITDRKQADIQITKHARELEYLSRRSVEMLALDEETDIFAFIGTTIKELMPPGSVVGVNQVENGGESVTTRFIIGLEPQYLELLGDVGSSLLRRTYPLSEASKEKLLSGVLTELHAGIRGVSENIFPEEVYRKIEQSGLSWKIYEAGLSWKKKVQGSVTLILPAGTTIGNLFAIDIYIQLSAIELQRRQISAELRRERGLFIGGPTVVFRRSSEPDWPIRYVSPNVLSLLGYSPEDLIRDSMPFAPFIHPEDRERVREEVRRYAEEGRSTFELEYRIRRTDGLYRWVHDFTVVERDKSGLVTAYHGYILDIEDRKVMERLLIENEENARVLINAPKESIFLMNPDGIALFINETTAERLGYPVEEMLGKSVYRFIPPEVAEKRKMYVDQVFRTRKQVHALDERNGKIIENNLYPIFDEEGKVSRIAVYGRDVTEKYEAERRIAESEERYRALAESSSDAIFIVDRRGTFRYMNLAGSKLLNLSPEKVIGLSVLDLFPHMISSEQIRQVSVVISSNMTVSSEMEVPLDHQPHWFDILLVPLHRKDGSVGDVMGSVRDITERKQMELSLREAVQKLKVLTGITRHDVLNDLSAITMSLELMEISEDPQTQHESLLRSLQAAKLLEKTIGFTREYEDFDSLSSRWMQLSSVVTVAERSVSVGDIRVDNTIPADLEVYADPIIRKVFTTLLENSVRHGRDITMIRISVQEEENNLIILYQDDGGGIDKREKELVFMHGYGKHTGIGLFLAREILSITGLSIRESGTPGEGVRFEIAVPKGGYRFLNSPRFSKDVNSVHLI